MPQAEATCLEAFYEAHLLTEVKTSRAFSARHNRIESWVFFCSKFVVKCARWADSPASKLSQSNRPNYLMRAYRWLALSAVAYPAVRVLSFSFFLSVPFFDPIQKTNKQKAGGFDA